MNSKDFVIWLKGFVAASNSYNLTPAGWDTLKDELSKVDDRHESILINPDIAFNPPYVSDNFTIGPDGAYENEEQEDDFFDPWPAPNEHLLEAANRYKEVLDEYDDYGKRVYKKQDRPTWYSTSTNDNLNN
jgi:hypothetical protein